MAAFPVEFPTIAGLAAQPQVKINVVDYGKVSAVHVKWLLNTSSKAASIGLDTEFDGHLLGLIQLATETRCLLIKVQKPGKGNPHKARTPNEALDDLFNDPTILKTGCELTKDALLLRSNFGHDIRGGIDLTQVYSPSDLDATERQTKGLFSLFSEMYLPDHRPLLKDKQTTTSRWVGVEFTPAQLSYGALDAWVSYKVGVHNLEKTLKAKALDFGNSKSGVLDCLMEQNSASLAVEDLKVKQYDSKFSKVTLRKDGAYEVLNTQFRNQLMFNDKVIVHFSNGINLPGKVSWGNYGKTKTVKLEKGVQAPRSSQVVKITVAEGGGNRGADEFLRDVFPKLVLHGLLDPTTIPMFNYLFLGKTKQIWPKAPPVYSLAKHKLNESQKRAVHTMLSDPKPINLIHGPPGTGKTYAITAAVAASITSKAQKSFYVLTCQTNAATRNLAVTLLKRGVSDFRIIVSDNFFVEWHEDQYKVIRDHVVQSLQTGNKEFENLIGPRTVVLCSLAQLSNPNLVSVFRARRVTHIVIDEASQISLVNIPHILALYATSLQRLTFVGDPKQLAPFGNEAHPGVESVFERLPADVMLNTQYRMPNDLGSFISRWVYKGRLLTEKKPRTQTSIALVNVEGATEVKSKTSFKNSREADTVVALIMNNYLKEEFLIITPYVAQKDLIVLRLEEAIRRRRAQQKFDVPLELAAERVHTVDTVQGQEANIIVFSAVRTFQPGFLNNKRRMNVALTRAKDRLIIVAKMSLFRSGSGSKSLLGDFVRYFEQIASVVDSKQNTSGSKLSFQKRLTAPQVTNPSLRQDVKLTPVKPLEKIVGKGTGDSLHLERKKQRNRKRRANRKAKKQREAALQY